MSLNVNNKINDIFNNKIVYGEKMNNDFLIKIMTISNDLFSIEQQEILKKETKLKKQIIIIQNLQFGVTLCRERKLLIEYRL